MEIHTNEWQPLSNPTTVPESQTRAHQVINV